MSRSVQGTAQEACGRKLHAVNKGYYHDPFATYFATDSTLINSPLMNRGYWLRVTAVQNTLHWFSAQQGGRPIQVVSLGSGFDTLFFQWASQGQSLPYIDDAAPQLRPLPIVRFVEIDVDEIQKKKQSIIQANMLLSSLVATTSCSGGCEVYQAISADLRNSEYVVSCLAAVNLCPDIATIIIAECVLVYMEGAESTTLLQQLTTRFQTCPSTCLVYYDAVHPDDRFGKMMCENLASIGILLPGIHVFKTPKDHQVRACDVVGFQQCTSMTMRQVYTLVPKYHMVALNKLELIDDWDEWNIVHDHYCLVVASSNVKSFIEVFPSSNMSKK